MTRRQLIALAAVRLTAVVTPGVIVTPAVAKRFGPGSGRTSDGLHPWPLPTLRLQVPRAEDREAAMRLLRVAECPGRCGNRELVLQRDGEHEWTCDKCWRSFQLEWVAYKGRGVA